MNKHVHTRLFQANTGELFQAQLWPGEKHVELSAWTTMGAPMELSPKDALELGEQLASLAKIAMGRK